MTEENVDHQMKLEFRGEPHNALLQVPDGLMQYMLSGLKNELCHPPEAAPNEWDGLYDVLVDQYVLPLLHRNTRIGPGIAGRRTISFGRRENPISGTRPEHTS